MTTKRLNCLCSLLFSVWLAPIINLLARVYVLQASIYVPALFFAVMGFVMYGMLLLQKCGHLKKNVWTCL